MSPSDTHLIYLPSPVYLDASSDLDPTASMQVIPVAGPAGPQGPPGAGIGYDHTQASPSASWIITHNLGYYPSVTVRVGGNLVLTDVAYGSVNAVTLTFASPQSGTAHLI